MLLIESFLQVFIFHYNLSYKKNYIRTKLLFDIHYLYYGIENKLLGTFSGKNVWNKIT